MQKSRFDDKKKGIVTSLDASKRGCLSARETTQQQWDEELAAHLQDKEDVSIAQHCELTTTNLEDPTLVPEDRSALLEVEVIVLETPILCLLSHILWSSHRSCLVKFFLMLDCYDPSDG